MAESLDFSPIREIESISLQRGVGNEPGRRRSRLDQPRIGFRWGKRLCPSLPIRARRFNATPGGRRRRAVCRAGQAGMREPVLFHAARPPQLRARPLCLDQIESVRAPRPYCINR